MGSITLSINPWYYCNFRCDFCYLTEAQLADRTLLPLEKLEQRLNEILCVSSIDMVDLYGGEVGLLPLDYVTEMKELLHAYGIHDINVITNLSMINEIIMDPDFYISVSYDLDVREKHELVFKNMTQLTSPFSVLMLASPRLIEKDVGEMIETLNLLPNLQSVEIKPYSTNQSNQHTVYYTQFEEFVKSFLQYPNKKFEFVNEKLINTVLDKTRNSFSDDHVYITPSGNYGVLEFDLNDNEFFLEYETLEQYFKWCQTEKARVNRNKYCSNCEYFGNCLSEHLREVKSLEHSCNGFKLLIDWYKNGRLESSSRVISQTE
jgi:sulfatase maturation enzyme AslB (radical SAM superfamily)